jgi:magnesium-transporting ATPase (P-type)
LRKKLIKVFFSYGENAFAPPHIKSLWELILENFNDKINLVLCAAAFVSMVIGIINHPHDPLEGMIEGTSICMALVIIIAVNSGNNYASERRIAKLLESAEKLEVAVWRGNTAEITVDSTELVVGDLIKIENGKKIAADCLMVEGQDVECVEAELTGEPDAIKKTPITKENYTTGALCTLLAKATVNGGMGKAIVIAVGKNSLAGAITEKTQIKEQDQRTEL